MKLFEEEVQARERAVASPATSLKKPAKGPSTAATFLTRGLDTGPTCCYCHQPHLSNSCQAVESTEERRRILREAGRCYVCLKKGHISRQCRSNARCTRCHGRHHSSICSTESAQTKTKLMTSNSAKEQSTSTTLPAGMNPTAPVFKPPGSTSTTLWTSTNQAILLQTAQAVVFNPDDRQRSKRVRIILDNGSQRSYISKQLKTELSLQSKGEQSMSIMTFGSRADDSRVCEVVNVCMEVRGGQTKQLTLFVVPLICEPLTGQHIAFSQDHFQHLSGLTLADPLDGPEQLEVDILIGSDQYWSLITGKTR